MSIELKMLCFTTILGILQLLAAAQAATAKWGFKYNLSCRDEVKPPLTGMAGRIDRAFKNFRETFAFFVAAVLLVQVGARNSELSALGAQIYFYARVVYVPCYIFGLIGVRTLVWLTSLIGLGLVLYSAVA